MGGSPVILESPSIMVSSPFHLTTTSLRERFVQHQHPSFGAHVAKHSDIKVEPTTSTDHDDNSFCPLSDDSSTDLHHDVTDCDPSHSSSCAPAVPKDKDKHVAFGNVLTRNYTVVMGDHPCCSMGCPLSLGWEYSDDSNISLDEYEATRSPRRHRENLRTTWDERRNMLSESGVSDVEVKRAERKLHRERSCQRKNRSRACEAFFKMEGIPEHPPKA